MLVSYLAWKKPGDAIALVVLLIPSYLLRFTVLSIPTNFFEAGVLILFIISIFRPEDRRQWRPARHRLPTSLIIFVSLFLIACIISTVISNQPRVSLGILKSWVFIPLLLSWVAFVYGYAANSLKIVNALILSGLATALIGFSQLDTLNRIKSIYDVPNSLALWLAPILVLAAWLAISRHKYSRLYSLFSLPIALALILTQSVSGVAAVVIALTVGMMFWIKPPAKKHYIIILFLLFLSTTTFFFISGRLQYLAAPLLNKDIHNSISVRLQLWDISWDLIKESPILGLGLGQFEPAYQQKLHERFQKFENCKIENCIPPIAEYVFRDPHNWILSFWLNTGLLGLVTFIGINITVIKQFNNLTIKQLPNRAIPQSLLLALVCILIFGLTDTIYWKNDLAVLYWLIIFLILSPSIEVSTPLDP